MFQSTLTHLPPSLQSRLRFQQHDFRQPQALSPSDERTVKAFILRMVLWNWADDVAVQILRGFVPVLQQSPDIALLINDAICCEPGGVDPHIEKQLRHLDMVMMVLNNAKIRTEADWRGLLTEADPGLKVSFEASIRD
jgi:O-methyltransferase domain